MSFDNSIPTPPPAPQAPVTTTSAPVSAAGPQPSPGAGEGRPFLTTWLLALLVGLFGVDRFYLGKIGTGILKLVTIGGLGLWWLIDLIIVLTGGTRDAAGRPLAGYDQHKRIAWIVTGAVIALGIVINLVIPRPATPPDDRPAASSAATASEEQPADEPADQPAEEPAMATVPEIVGMTIGTARPAVEASGLTLSAPADATDDSVIATQSIVAGQEVEEGAAVAVTVEPPKPQLTIEQQNAIDKAKDYLAFAGFSRAGLIGQLEFEGFATEVATFGADNAGADWNAEAAEKAKSYLDLSAFSRQGLYDQLEFEKFTPEQIEFALKSVGY